MLRPSNTQGTQQNRPREIQQNTLQKSQENTKKDEGPWLPVERLLATKIRGKERIYKVLWKEPGDGPKTTCEPASNISDILKQEYHMNRTLKGTLQRDGRNERWHKAANIAERNGERRG